MPLPKNRAAITSVHRTGNASPTDQTTFTWDGTQLTEQHRTNGPITTWTHHPYTTIPLSQHDITVRGELTQAEIDHRFHAIVTDLLGTPTELLTPDGTIAWRARTNTWGNPIDEGAVPPKSSVAIDCPLRFPGQYWDPETGLHYNNNRYYDPTTARYLTPDPLGITPAPNPHAYVPNPTHQTDPLGLAPCTPDPTWGGQVQFGALDTHGRATGIHASITPNMIGGGSRASYDPPGLSTAGGHARGHLLGKQLGGSGSVPENIVPLFHNPVNTPIMRDYENAVRKAVESGQTVQYSVIPNYNGANPVPTSVTITANGSQGYRLHVTIPNP